MMANMVPAGNVQAAALAGFIALLMEHLCQANGIIIPQDVSEALPGVFAIIVAHISDLITGANKPTPQESQSQAAATTNNVSPPTS